jgi:hypothetical protein
MVGCLREASVSSAVRDRTARSRIREYLTHCGAVVDARGRATALLKDAVEYQGSPVAFIQLVTAMDKDSEIEREIRGKRTYRISSRGDAALAPDSPATPPASAPISAAPVDLNYDELARALLREAWRGLSEDTRSPGELRPLEALRQERDQVIAERDEYAMRLQIASQQLSALLNESTPAAAGSAIDRAATDVLGQVAGGQDGKRAVQAS